VGKDKRDIQWKFTSSISTELKVDGDFCVMEMKEAE
jgi:hypothetical protein